LATEEGSIVSQSFLASSFEECQKHFEEEGFCVLSVKRDWKRIKIQKHFEEEGFCVLSVKRDWKRIKIPVLPFEKKIKDRDFIMINQELVALIKAGYPILKCIQIILKRVKNIHLKELLMKVENEIRGGKSLSEAFAPYEKNFSQVYIASLMAGERTGNLAGTINRYIDYAKVISQTKAKMRAALTYPTLLILFAFILLMILINFVLPRFTIFYADFETELPAITRGLLSFSQSLRTNFPFLIVFVVLLYVIYSLLKRKEKTLVIRDRIKLKIPYGGSILVESGVSLFSRTLGLILEAGISLVSAVGIANHAVPNYFIIQKSKQLPELIKDGKSLSESLSRIDFFPPLSLDMIRIGD
jgi:type IV pilus assembly protein PilC